MSAVSAPTTTAAAVDPYASARAAQPLLGRVNPLAKLGALVVITVALVWSIDWLSAGIAVLGELLVLPLAGLNLRTLWLRAWPLVCGALLGGWSTAVLAPDKGPLIFSVGIWTMGEHSLLLGVGFALRGLAIALPAVIMMACTEPTELADALAQLARLPHRFVLGTLAALRLVGLMVEEWQTIGMARRARGVGSSGGFLAGIGAKLGQSFGLLVQSIRRASRLAVTMEARGFGAGPRSWARPSRMVRADAWVLLGAVLLAGLAVGTSLLTGAWHVVY
ncbi:MULTISPECIES: energy-coupling factor transporter transmembrane component T [Arthrobacter]|uniref:Energy-coupling factor transporter transmembrane component T n=2 Tax=Arthrobacter TaxID=1663 RepID=A0ABU9KLH0_9MICC|nr:energy-coupling factor transporter transmembrane component T [Arthrobacter sp. YJM1]MDP5226735.1 energy-coupling factor transporter transmembrane component T [Arthrobacter sp. YJM1]